MKTRKTTEDGWYCDKTVKEISTAIQDVHHLTYEIDNCVRTSSMQSIHDTIKKLCEELTELISDLETEVEYETIYDDEE
jgi:predicted RNA-binding protein with EMAP domain